MSASATPAVGPAAAAWTWLHTLNWGTVPESVTWIVAAFALGFAARAARAAQTTTEQQAEQLRLLKEAETERQELQRSAQARAIALWVRVDPAAPEEPHLLLSNASDLPAFNVVLSFMFEDGTTVTAEMDHIPPHVLDHEDPGVSAFFADLLPRLARNPGGRILRERILAEFTDQGGVRWTRRLDGTLNEAGAATPSV